VLHAAIHRWDGMPLAAAEVDYRYPDLAAQLWITDGAVAPAAALQQAFTDECSRR